MDPPQQQLAGHKFTGTVEKLHDVWPPYHLGQRTGSPSTFPLWSLFSKNACSSLPPTAIIFNIKSLPSPLTHLHFCSEAFFWIFIWIAHIFQFCNCLYLKIIIYGFIILCNLFSQFFVIITGSVLFCDRKAISYTINKMFCVCFLEGNFFRYYCFKNSVIWNLVS